MAERTRPSSAPWQLVATGGPGVGLAVGVAAVATVLGRLVPLVGAPVLAIVIGVLLSRGARQHSRLRAGLSFASRTLLQVAVVALGTQLSLRQVADVGLGSLPVMLGTLAVCLALAVVIGRGMAVETDLRTLIGVGTAICGASAIAAVSPVIRAKNVAVAYAISTIFLFNVAAVLLFPPLGHLLGLSQHAFGLFAGTAVNDTSSVVAAAASYGGTASHDAVVVKLTRTLMIIPICLGLAEIGRRRAGASEPTVASPGGLRRAAALVPWFLVAFLVVAATNSLGLMPPAVRHTGQTGALFLIATALAAIGLSTDLASVRRAGARPLLLGFLLWVAVATTSLLLQAVNL